MLQEKTPASYLTASLVLNEDNLKKSPNLQLSIIRIGVEISHEDSWFHVIFIKPSHLAFDPQTTEDVSGTVSTISSIAWEWQGKYLIVDIISAEMIARFTIDFEIMSPLNRSVSGDSVTFSHLIKSR